MSEYAQFAGATIPFSGILVGSCLFVLTAPNAPEYEPRFGREGGGR